MVQFNSKLNTAWKVSVSRVFLARIFPHSDWICRDPSPYSVRMRENTDQNIPNTETFHAVEFKDFVPNFRIKTVDQPFFVDNCIDVVDATIYSERFSCLRLLFVPLKFQITSLFYGFIIFEKNMSKKVIWSKKLWFKFRKLCRKYDHIVHVTLLE